MKAIDRFLVQLVFLSLVVAFVSFVSCKKDRDKDQDKECRALEMLFHIAKDESLEIRDLDYSRGTYTYDDQGRLSNYELVPIHHASEHYNITYSYDYNVITETLRSIPPNDYSVSHAYHLDSQGRIEKQIAISNYRERTTTYVYDIEGYLVKRSSVEYVRSEKREEIDTYIYSGGNLTKIETLLYTDGSSFGPLETELTYNEQAQPHSFYFFDEYMTPLPHPQYHPLRKYFGRPSKNMISSVREFLGYGYANSTYTYEMDSEGNVGRAVISTDSNGSQILRFDFSVQCP